jgi:hypothetical protein
VGSGPLTALAQLLQDTRKRIDDDQPPTPVSPETWFPEVEPAEAGDALPR